MKITEQKVYPSFREFIEKRTNRLWTIDSDNMNIIRQEHGNEFVAVYYKFESGLYHIVVDEDKLNVLKLIFPYLEEMEKFYSVKFEIIEKIKVKY